MKSKEENVTLSIYVPRGLKRWLWALAEKNGRTLVGQVRFMLEESRRMVSK